MFFFQVATCACDIWRATMHRNGISGAKFSHSNWLGKTGCHLRTLLAWMLVRQI